MATPAHGGSPPYYEPRARYGHAAVETNGKVYLWGGLDSSGRPFPDSEVEVFETSSGSWSTVTTKGTPPTAVAYCAYTAIGDKIYTYGGCITRGQYSDDIHELNLTTMTWRKLTPKNPSSGPTKKWGCQMVSYNKDMLVVYGGVQDTYHSICDELHVYNLREGTWSSPRVTGTPPGPRADFSFTKIDDQRVVLFGGNKRNGDKASDVYILDMQRWHWRKVPTSGGPSPVGRAWHTTCSLSISLTGPHQLLTLGGWDQGLNVLGDAWILHLESGTWTQVELPGGVGPRRSHTATVVACAPGSVHLLLFGGVRGGYPIAATTVLQMEGDGKVGEPLRWRVAGVATPEDPVKWREWMQRADQLIKLGAVSHADTAPASSSDTRAAYQDRTKLLEKELQEKATEIQQLTQDMRDLESQQAKLQKELSTTQKELSEVEGEHSVQKKASESLQEQLVESELKARTAEQESQQAREELQKANQQLRTVQREQDEFAAVVELKDKQMDWERKELDEYKRAHSQLQSAVSRQEKELDHLREENTHLLDHQSTHKHDPTYPGVCFFGDPLQASVDSSGRLIQWPQVGITLDIPPGAVPSGEVLYLSIWPCLSGPYVLPLGFELVSPAYLIKPAFHFKKPVKLSLAHFAKLSTDEDCDEMTFVSAYFSSETTGKKPEYHFRVLDKGAFRQGENVGTICVTHFCAPAVARKRKRNQEAEIPSKRQKGADLECSVPADVEYSLLLYHIKSIPYKRDGYAIFSVSLCHALYLENLSKDIKEQFPGIQFWLFQKHRVQMTRDAVEVKHPHAVGRWRIEPDRKPLRISQKDVDLPNYHPELSRSKEHYPPRMLLTITSPQEGAKDAKCPLRVVGVSEHVEFLMQLKREPQPDSGETLPHSPPHSSATLGERPTLRMLLAFPAREGMLNIPDMIGTSYTQLGIFLLEDDEGTKVNALENQYRDNATKINIEILREWIQGRGKQPVIWRTLAEYAFFHTAWAAIDWECGENKLMSLETIKIENRERVDNCKRDITLVWLQGLVARRLCRLCGRDSPGTQNVILDVLLLSPYVYMQ